MRKARWGGRRTRPRAKVEYHDQGGWKTADLIIEPDRFVLVVSWRSSREARMPYVCFELEPGRLERLQAAQALYRYHGRLGRPCNMHSIWALLHARAPASAPR